MSPYLRDADVTALEARVAALEAALRKIADPRTSWEQVKDGHHFVQLPFEIARDALNDQPASPSFPCVGQK